MIGLKTARAVVVDNNIEEGAALLRALSEYGIGASFFNGDPDELPKEKLKGIRLLAVDMDLTGAGQGEPRQVLAPVINIIDHLIAHYSAPFVVLAWTQYPDLVDEFRNMFEGARPDLKPYFIVRIAKAEVRKDEDPSEFDIEKILQNLKTNAKSWFPFDLIMDWEQRVHDAATETTSSLNEIIDKNGDGDLAEKASRLFAALALASGEQTASDKESALKHLFTSLNPIHEDRLENLQIDVARLDEQADKMIRLINEERQKQQGSTGERSFIAADQRGKLNNMLLLATVTSGEYSPRPGNVYFKKGWSQANYPIAADNITHVMLANDLLKALPQDSAKKRYIIYACIPAIIEITPYCDYSQANTLQSRLLAGLFVPERYNKKHMKTNAQFIRTFGPFYLDKNNLCPLQGPHYLMLNSRYIIGIKNQNLAQNKEAFRLRKQALVDIQSWFASQAARPGYIQINP